MYLSIDEAASIHETVVEHITWRIWPTLDTRGYSHYPWVFAGAAFVLIVGVTFLRFLFRLPSRTRLGFVVSGLIFVGGALGIDILQANHDDRYGRQTFGFAMFVAVEEGMEMTGVLIFLQTLFVYIASCLADTPVLLRPMESTGSAARDLVTGQQPNLGLPPSPITAISVPAEPASSSRPRQASR